MTLLTSAPDDRTVFARFARTAGRCPTRAFFVTLPETADVYGIDAGEITYGAALARIETLVAAYRAAGYGPGHRIGLLLQNRPDFVLHWFALNALGASVVPINPDLRAAELEYLTAHSEMVLAVAIPSRVEDLRQAGGPALAVIPVVTVP